MTTAIQWTDVQAWIDPKIAGVAMQLDSQLAQGIQDTLFAKLQSVFDTSGWGTATTPSLVVKILSMTYVAYLYNRTYAGDEQISSYASFLLEQANELTVGLLTFAITLPDASQMTTSPLGSPVFYPNDA